MAALRYPTLYARIDLLAGVDGPLLLELELIEPALFLETAAESVGLFARAIRDAL